MSEEKKLKIEKVDIAEGGRYGKFVCEPLDRGYGITLGNSLRRILLSSLDGAAITSIKIDGVLHEFSTIPGIREDVTDIILNLKQLCIKLEEEMCIRDRQRQYRIIDFKRTKDNIPAKVATIEYDPNRSSRIALLNYADGEKRYILAPNGLKVGDVVFSGPESDIKPGNCLPLANIPDGTQIHNIELKIGKGGQIVRSAGTSAQLMGKDNGYAILRLPSGEMRRVRQECRATVGVVGNAEHSNLVIGKAGRHRWIDRKSTRLNSSHRL